MALTLATAGPAAAATGPDIVADVNALRAAHGLPAAITVDPGRSAGCALHNRYLVANQTIGHEEDPAHPSYTDAGAAAGSSSVLQYGGGWTPGETFLQAPLHLMQLLNPRLAVSGADEFEGHACIWTLTEPSAWSVAPVDAVYTYPGPGVAGVPFEERAFELPYVPGDFVGLPAGTATGPHLYVLPDGPWAIGDAGLDGDPASRFERPFRIERVALAGPDGAVPVRITDDSVEAVAPYVPAGGIIIPERPLRGAATYRAEVSLLSSETGIRRDHAWSFTTAARENLASTRLKRLRLRPRGSAGTYRVVVASPADRGSVILRGPRRRVRTLALTAATNGALVSRPVVLAAGRWQVCSTTGGPPSEYQPATSCRSSRLMTRLRPLPARRGRG